MFDVSFSKLVPQAVREQSPVVDITGKRVAGYIDHVSMSNVFVTMNRY